MVKRIVFLLVTHGSCIIALSQYWQQEVNYNIEVALNDKNHSLKGVLKLEYTNNSPDTLNLSGFISGRTL
jgi:hypothetical protein